jgi:23S rRNA pseudouridine1911/1915/1917 synthase
MVWQVQPGDGKTVASIVDAMRAMGAPSEGRVFLNGRPAEPNEPVDRGDRVELWPRRIVPETSGQVVVLAQRDGVVLVDKPAPLPAETTQLGQDSVVSALIEQLKGGRVHVASRLDVGVSGVLLCTLGKDAAGRVEEWRAAGVIDKRYIGFAQGRIEGEGEWAAPLGRLTDRAGRHRSSTEGRDPKRALTRYRALAHTEHATCLVLEPVTGRMHQLRAHAAFAGLPLYGDRRYGGPSTVTLTNGSVRAINRVALHASRVAMPHLEASAAVPPAMRQLWRDLGGNVDVLP